MVTTLTDNSTSKEYGVGGQMFSNGDTPYNSQTYVTL